MALVAITLAVYGQVLGHQFIIFDDDDYVTSNEHLRRSVADAIRWAFSFHSYAANWHPLTWISHLVDVRLFGLGWPGGHHLTSLLWHLANVILLDVVLWRATRAPLRSAFVAAVFAVHPLHVESVAWVSERKDVLSTFFWLLAMAAYVRYAERPGALRLTSVHLALALGLLAKPMLVTLPFVLLLLDRWPLGRGALGWALLREKAGLVLMVAGACVATWIAQSAGGAMASLERLPLSARLGNAAISYVAYLGEMFWPSRLVPFYPFDMAAVTPWRVGGALAFLIIVSAWVLRCRSRYPYLITGWLWYLGTLVPVIGLVQVGTQSMADRYTYMTLTGPLIMIAWGAPDLLRSAKGSSRVGSGAAGRVVNDGSGAGTSRMLAAATLAVIAALAILAAKQASRWRDPYTLFSYTLGVNRGNYIAEDVLGWHFLNRGQLDEAIAHLSRGVALEPGIGDPHNNLGLALIRKGRAAEAIRHFELAARLEPGVAEPLHNLGLAYLSQGRTDRAYQYCSRAMRIDPESPRSHNVMGAILWDLGKQMPAVAEWTRAVSLDSKFAEPHESLAKAWVTLHRYQDAWKELHTFERLGGTPDSALTRALSERMADPGR